MRNSRLSIAFAIIAFVVLCALFSLPWHQDNPDLPNILFIGVGGTIAGVANSVGQTAEYQSGVLGIDQLIKAAPKLRHVCNPRFTQLANVDSIDLNSSINIEISLSLQEALDDDRVDKGRIDKKKIHGAVVVMGTDSLEESAFFIDSTINSTKPVVITGAIRPSSDMSPDGPGNLVSSAIVAGSKSAMDRGVLVVFNNKIFSGHMVTKTDANSLDAFQSESSLGRVYKNEAQFFFNPARPTHYHHFDIDRTTSLPRVEIGYGHQEHDPEFVSNAIEKGIKAIVWASMGGYLPSEVVELIKLLAPNLFHLIDQRQTFGFAGGNHGFLGAGFLKPQQARIKTQLVLGTNQDPRDFFHHQKPSTVPSKHPVSVVLSDLYGAITRFMDMSAQHLHWGFHWWR